MSKVWMITGANRGIGLEIARAVLAAGNQVVATARKPEQIEKELTDYGDRLLNGYARCH
jgi:NAD(P)-dependent dehydrogenase (short-subunit alcohol dehydrogenase family)